jgi:hypothetical protein
VVESRKYGRPMVPSSRPRIHQVGSSAPVGFQRALVTIGRKARLASSSAMCSAAWARTRRWRVTQSEYA